MDLATWKSRKVLLPPGPGVVVEYLVLSEFDITTGSTVRHQYPSEVPGVQGDWLAEQQIPEGIHARESDASYIFINRNGTILDSALHEQEQIDKKDITDFFLFGINVVRTRKDDTVKRGAVVKSLALFSRWHFVESFKWVLSKGLDNYFKEPNLETLVTLYQSLNSMDLTGLSLPTTLERQLMQRNVGKVGEMVQVLNERQQSVKIIDSASLSPSSENRDDGVWVDEAEDAMLQYCQPSHWVHKVDFEYNGESHDMSIFPHLSPDEIGDINVVRLLRALKGHTITIFNALLKGSRVMIVGHGHSAKDIAQYVLSAAAMVAPSCPGVLRRVHPYVNLSDLSFLEGSQGYLAGALNPMFAQKEEWWDILVDFGATGSAGQAGSSSEDQNVISVTVKAGMDPGRSLGGGTTGASEETLDTSAHSVGSEDDAASERRMLERSKAQLSGDRAFVAALLAEVNVEKLGEEAVRLRFGDLGRACLMQACDDSALLSSDKLSDLSRRSFLVNAHRSADIKATGGIAKGSFRRLWGVGAHWGSAGSDSDTEDGQEGEDEDEDDEQGEEGVNREVVKTEETRASVATCRHVVRLLSRRLLHEEGLHWGEMKALLTGLLDAITTPQDCTHREELTQLMVLMLPAETSGVGADGTDIYACLGVSGHGLQVIASSLFSAAPSVRRVAAQLLDIVRRYKSTIGAFYSLNPMLRHAYSSHKRKDQQALAEEEMNFAASTVGSRTTGRQPAVSSRDASFF